MIMDSAGNLVVDNNGDSSDDSGMYLIDLELNRCLSFRCIFLELGPRPGPTPTPTPGARFSSAVALRPVRVFLPRDVFPHFDLPIPQLHNANGSARDSDFRASSSYFFLFFPIFLTYFYLFLFFQKNSYFFYFFRNLDKLSC